MAVPMFDPKEITEAKTISFGGRTQTIFNYPCSQREGTWVGAPVSLAQLSTSCLDFSL